MNTLSQFIDSHGKRRLQCAPAVGYNQETTTSPTQPTHTQMTAHDQAQAQFNILFVGRNTSIADLLRVLVVQALRADGAGPYGAQKSGGDQPRGVRESDVSLPSADGSDDPSQSSHLEFITNQKAALRFALTHPTPLVLVETHNKPGSRVRFCETLRQRLPDSCIVAVGSPSKDPSFRFDAALATPIQSNEAIDVIRRLHNGARESTIRRGPITLYTTQRRVESPLGERELTPKQCALLEMLMQNEGKVVRRADIMSEIWETSYLEDTRTLDVHIRWLRQVIEPEPAEPIYLQTKRGQGYIFSTHS
jgi:DNA-binding response OmpR family regulator